MLFLRCAFLWLICAGPVWSQPFGLTQRLPNTSLRLPSTPPTYGYALTNAFGTLTFANPVCITAPPGEASRLFVVEQPGVVAVITNLAAPTRTVFLDITARVIGGTGGGEEGLLGMAFHPGYATNGFFFLYFTATATTRAGTGRHQILSRFQVSTTNPNAAPASSEVSLLTMFDEHSDHNGGDVHFGPDGFLYLSLGDEGDQNDALDNSQRITKDFWSSILRLDVDVPARPTSLPPKVHPANTNHVERVINYSIPADNPFVGVTSFNGSAVSTNLVRTEMFAVGFRNPWRFSIDAVTGWILCGDVGGDALEEIDAIKKGGNYGWAFREGTNAGPKAANMPGGLALTPPLFTYRHGTATNQGNAVVGGRIYRGGRIPALLGKYIFGDYVSGNVWALDYDGTNATGLIRLADDTGIAAFGVDPSNGDILTADQNNDTIKRLVAVSTPTNTLPATLADTGVFTNLATLTPHASFVPYDVNLPFWSDHAIKTRWFYVPTNGAITFGATNNWTFPTGTVWVKHFDLELTNGVPASRKRIETRVLVRHAGTAEPQVYGLTYRWGGSLTNATLVPDGGLTETNVIRDAGTTRTQVWHFPGRSECLLCHTRASQGGLALGFHTAQLNRDFNYSGVTDNQLRALNHAGYFTSPVTNLNSFRRLAALNDETASVESRVRSYLAANCAQCHQPGGNGLGQFDARLFTPLSAAKLIHGSLRNDGGSISNEVIAPTSLSRSMLLTRISSLEPGRRMPPLGSSVPDTNAIVLVSRWITNDLATYQTFAEWQLAQFGSTNATVAQPGADPDGDGANNQAEYLTGTSPWNGGSVWSLGAARNATGIVVSYPRVPNRITVLERSGAITNPLVWSFWDLPANRPFAAATNGIMRLEDSTQGTSQRQYRARVIEP